MHQISLAYKTQSYVKCHGPQRSAQTQGTKEAFSSWFRWSRHFSLLHEYIWFAQWAQQADEEPVEMGKVHFPGSYSELRMETMDACNARYFALRSSLRSMGPTKSANIESKEVCW